MYIYYTLLELHPFVMLENKVYVNVYYIIHFPNLYFFFHLGLFDITNLRVMRVVG